MNLISKTRVGLAGAAALIALASMGASTTAFAADAPEKPTRCYGANSCKGKGLCATAKHDCKGLNECKGQGVLAKTPTECKAMGGSLTELAS
ncbi:hypothetical protein HHL21_07865 [Massilia sp. RP-1-19]|uniref:Silver efflux pump n=1 Tax=Massilia polaris TaxID=2728846 RepID=A0A848HIX4_9BURK|nr:hypothetical protein [Massilia polaris]NML60997.1 hypothetical protein [Massilia polaris]